MSNYRTMEGIVRERARTELEREVSRVLFSVKELLGPLNDEEFVKLATAQLEEMRKRVLDDYTPDREQYAVDEFVRKVMRMKEGA